MGDPDEKVEARPHEKRRGWLKNGNPPGDFSKAPRCGAQNRRGKPCRCPAMRNGRCRLHGGLSTGPRTPEGIARLRAANTKHGLHSARMVVLRTAGRTRLSALRQLIDSLEP
jgi:hypothetical protein